MSQELERVYTIPLGKVLISQSQHRAVRAINMIKEFAQHHMKVEIIKIDEELAHQIWARGVRSPPRKIKVRMSKTDEGYVLFLYLLMMQNLQLLKKKPKKLKIVQRLLKKHLLKKHLLKKHLLKKHLKQNLINFVFYLKFL